MWLFLLYSPGAVDKKSQENSWRYVDQRSEIVQGFMKQESVTCHNFKIPVVVSLDLSEVVRSANSNVPLYPNSNHQINAHTKRYSEADKRFDKVLCLASEVTYRKDSGCMEICRVSGLDRIPQNYS